MSSDKNVYLVAGLLDFNVRWQTEHRFFPLVTFTEKRI